MTPGFGICHLLGKIIHTWERDTSTSIAGFVVLRRLVHRIEAAPSHLLCIGTGEDGVACEDAPNGLAGANPDSWLKANKNIIIYK